MKKLLTLIATAVIAVTACFGLTACGGSEKVLQVYTNAGFAPFEYVNEQGQVVGVDIDIMNYIGNKLGYKVVINDIAFKQILPEVENYKYAVGAAGMSKNDERDATANASIVYATSVQYVIAPNGAFGDNEVVTLEALANYSAKIGVQSGTTGQFMIEDYIAAEELENQIVEYSNAIVASGDIGTATIGAVIIDELPAKAIAGANANLSCWKIVAEPETYVLYFNKEATELLEQVNGVLQQMITDGIIDQYIVNHSSGN